jgi:uncharacterized Fe-S cluster-containing radical SAM superfamily protein
MCSKVVLLVIGRDLVRNTWAMPLVPPVGALALGSYLASHGVECEIVDVAVDFGFGATVAGEHAVHERVAGYLQEQASRIAWVGISQLSNNPSGVALAREVRAALPNTPILCGGYFPSTNYDTLLRLYPFVTAVVRGDGEVAALEISRSIAEGRPFLGERTPNLAWLDDGEIRTSRMSHVAPADLPAVDYRQLRNPSGYDTAVMATSRGCPFRCSYCLEHALRPFAPHSIDWVQRQVAHIESVMPQPRLWLLDPIVGPGRNRILEICRVMAKSRFRYAIESRVEALPPDLLPALAQSGLELVFLGFESASPATLVRMNKVRSEKQAQRYLDAALQVFAACFEAGVVAVPAIMLGFPGDKEADLRATVTFLAAIRKLCRQAMERPGNTTGFVPSPQPTYIYRGSQLASCLEQEYPDVVLGPETYMGERTVLSPSAGVDRDTVIGYEALVQAVGEFPPQAVEIFNAYMGMPSQVYLQTHAGAINR